MPATTLDGSWDASIGTPVFTADDRRLGYVVDADPWRFVVGDGFLFRRRYTVKFCDVERFENGTLLLKYTMEQVEERSDAV